MGKTREPPILCMNSMVPILFAQHGLEKNAQMSQAVMY